MTELEYLREYHHISQTGIGIALLHDFSGNTELVIDDLKELREKLKNLRYEYQPKLKELEK